MDPYTPNPKPRNGVPIEADYDPDSGLHAPRKHFERPTPRQESSLRWVLALTVLATFIVVTLVFVAIKATN